MDPIEKQQGLDEQNFWHRAKLDLIETLLKKVGKRDMHILVVGCGTGEDIEVIQRYGKVVVCDSNIDALRGIKYKVVKKHMDVTSLGFKDKCFDVVLSLDVFEHIKDDSTAIRECFRVLRNEGYLILTVPSWQVLFSTYDSHLGHIRRYNKAGLKKKLKLFNRVYLGYWNCFLFFPFAIERVIKKVIKHKPYTSSFPLALNNLFYKMLVLENSFIKRGYVLPIGMTLCGVYKKGNS